MGLGFGVIASPKQLTIECEEKVKKIKHKSKMVKSWKLNFIYLFIQVLKLKVDF